MKKGTKRIEGSVPEFVRTEKRKEPTGLKCINCLCEIEKVFHIEYDKATGEKLSEVCTWDQRRTCSETCKCEQEIIFATHATEINGVPMPVSSSSHFSSKYWEDIDDKDGSS